MTARGRIAAALGAALLLGGMGTTPSSPRLLPGACDLLQSLPADDLVGQSLRYQMTQDRAGDDARMSMCQGLDADELPVVSLLLLQDISQTAPQPGPAQRETMVEELTHGFGQAPTVELPDIGEAALWVPEIGQLIVWSGEGRVMFIVTSGGDADLATRIAKAILAHLQG